MGFWDTVGKIALDVAKSVATDIQESAKESRAYKEEMQSKSDQELLKVIVSNIEKDSKKAAIARGELVSRGNEPDDVKKMIQNEYKYELSSKSDEQLIAILKSRANIFKMNAVGSILVSRGYSKEEIKGIYNKR